MTDSEIDDFDKRDLSEFDLYRLKSSPSTLIEFRIDDMTGWVKTTEIRHEESPVVLNTSIAGIDRFKCLNKTSTVPSFNRTLSATLYLKIDEPFQSFYLKETPELKSLLNFSFTFFDDFFYQDIGNESFFETRNIVLVEYLLPYTP
ncbi:hypothetical protein [Algoriphagus aquimarinus]|nr:hypothetical protein [Algoriphagus aquimarinus]